LKTPILLFKYDMKFSIKRISIKASTSNS
jgi:hypothetical protein